ncbi:MAG: HNH endonuclease [Synergistes sp.]|nr:HNH endonuclease [Synergistes sp.]
MAFIEYSKDYATADYQGEHFVRDKQTGYFLSSRKIGNRRQRLHRFVFENEVAQIPKGYHVHHKDENKNNNDPANLELLSASEHETLHASDWSEERLEKAKKNLDENARPEAIKWHKSKAGREWHREHGRDVWKQRQARTYNCSWCKKEFESLNIYGENENHFCSNNCKSAYRRHSGVDNIMRPCANCGEDFEVNKYAKRKYCDKCQSPESRKARQRRCL